MRIKSLKVLSSSEIYYRGISGVYNKNYLNSQHIIWFTKDKDLAREYADSKNNIHEFRLSVKNSFKFGFRTANTYVKIKDMTGRIKVVINDLGPSKLTREKAFDLFDRLGILEEKYKNKMEPVYYWWNEIVELSKILKDSGFDSIQSVEGQNSDLITVGVLDKNLIHKI